jgi:serine/threonine protein kinase
MNQSTFQSFPLRRILGQPRNFKSKRFASGAKKVLGSGNYAIVYGATDTNQNPVALKINDCNKHGLYHNVSDAGRIATEIAALRVLGDFPFIAGLANCGTAATAAEHGPQAAAIEYDPTAAAVAVALRPFRFSLQDLISRGGGPAEGGITYDHVRLIMKCALLGLARLHRGGAGHYDVSANNILYGEFDKMAHSGPQDPKRGLAALADLGLLAPAAGARGPRVMLLNRAPEIVLHMCGRLASYTAAADVFGAGCVLADLLRLCARRARAAAGAPAVAGEGLATFGDLMDPALWDDEDAEAEPSAEAYFHVYYRIMGVPRAAPGTPAAAGAFEFPLAGAPAGAVALARRMLALDPAHRPTVEEVLADEFFASMVFDGAPSMADLAWGEPGDLVPAIDKIKALVRKEDASVALREWFTECSECDAFGDATGDTTESVTGDAFGDATDYSPSTKRLKLTVEGMP